MPSSLSPRPLPLRHRLAMTAGLLLWGGAECLALWRSRRQHAREVASVRRERRLP